jgi:predicted amidohydrolase
MRTLRVSLAQITCIDGAVEHNLLHAYELANEASRNGAELVLFPEFMPQGYRLTNDL